MNLFDILGPVMVGPSSSHTAGAVRIGWMTQKLLGEQPVEAKILMYGSFQPPRRAGCQLQLRDSDPDRPQSGPAGARGRGYVDAGT